MKLDTDLGYQGFVYTTIYLLSWIIFGILVYMKCGIVCSYVVTISLFLFLTYCFCKS